MDGKSFASVFDDLRSRLMSVSRRIVGNQEDAADAVQDAFCRLWTRRGAMNSREALTGASIVTVRNLSVDCVRHRRTMPTAEIEQAEAAAVAETSREEREDAYAEVMAVMRRQLTETQQTVLKLRELNGWEYGEIASHLGMTQEAVRMQMSRARCKIRDFYRNKQA